VGKMRDHVDPFRKCYRVCSHLGMVMNKVCSSEWFKMHKA